MIFQPGWNQTTNSALVDLCVARICRQETKPSVPSKGKRRRKWRVAEKDVQKEATPKGGEY